MSEQEIWDFLTEGTRTAHVATTRSALGTAGAAPYRCENGCGTARDVVSFLVRLRPRISLTPGAGFLGGCSLLLRACGLDSSVRPRFPGRYHLAGWQSGRGEGRDGRGDR